MLRTLQDSAGALITDALTTCHMLAIVIVCWQLAAAAAAAVVTCLSSAATLPPSANPSKAAQLSPAAAGTTKTAIKPVFSGSWQQPGSRRAVISMHKVDVLLSFGGPRKPILFT
jgi:hypothetical protein